MSAWNLGVSKNKCLFPVRTMGVCFVLLEVKPGSLGMCWGDPQKKKYNLSDFVTLPNPVRLWPWRLGLNLLAQVILACSQHWVLLFHLAQGLFHGLGGFMAHPKAEHPHGAQTPYPHASSNREFLLLQALPSCLPQAGKMTLLAQPLCHSIPVVNKTLSVRLCCFSSMALSVCWSVFPIHWDTNPTHCYCIPQLPTVRQSIFFERQT